MQSILPALESTNKLFLSGPFGCGKSTLAVERVRWLIRQERVRGDDILILVPQRTLAQTYYTALRSADLPPGTGPQVTTVAGLARNAVQLYWPLLTADGGFPDDGNSGAKREPTFLNLETSQYHMGQFVDAALERGDFDGVVVERNRIISQVLDNLNKAALHGFSIDEAYQRLELAVPTGEQQTARLNALRAARQISNEFRALCLNETLIDFSLQIELFNDQVLVHQWSRTHLFRSHRHLVFDNLEEDTHTAHGLVHAWLPHLESALLLADSDAGYRFFLGADPEGVEELAKACDEQITLSRSHVMSNTVAALADGVDRAMRGRAAVARDAAMQGDTTPAPMEATTHDDVAEESPHALDALTLPDVEFRFYPQMISWVVEEVRRLVHDDGLPPGEIAILSPFVSDALRFSLQTSLAEHGITCTTHRPSRALQDEPSARCLVTLALLAHPEWGIRPAADDVTLALTLAISALDPVRAHLLSQIVYPPRRKIVELGRFGSLVPAMQERITFRIGEAYDRLQGWLAGYRASADPVPLDQFFARLFGELLSQPDYGFHQDLDAARIANQLVESARNFRWSLENTISVDGLGCKASVPSTKQDDGLDWRVRLGREYVQLFESGALGALYVPGWRISEDAVFLAPAYTFLMRNQPVDVQFWLDIGAGGWWERLYQPLTHPFVLSRRWSRHELWSDAHEYDTRQQTMRRLLLGLVRRTRGRIYVTMSDYSESGFEQRGPLMALVNRLLAQTK